MFRVINEYLTKVKLRSDDNIRKRISDFLDTCEAVKKYTITVNFNQYIVDIKLCNFSIDEAGKCFADYNKNVSYSYSSLYMRFNEGKCVRYRYITSRENKDAFYCDIIFS